MVLVNINMVLTLTDVKFKKQVVQVYKILYNPPIINLNIILLNVVVNILLTFYYYHVCENRQNQKQNF